MDILFVTATRIGDAVLSSGLLGYLIERHPGARLTISAGPVAAPLFEAVPGLERLITIRKRRFAAHWLELYGAVVGRRWDIVVDPFLGSGSTLVAAEKTGRVCRGLELDPLYVDVIVRRYEALTGAAAVLVDTGETFEILAARRAGEREEPASACENATPKGEPSGQQG